MANNLANAFAEAEDDNHTEADVEQGSPEEEQQQPAEGAEATEEVPAQEAVEDERLAEGGEQEEEESETPDPQAARKKKTARERREERKKHLRLLEEQNALLSRQYHEVVHRLAVVEGGTLQTQYNVVDSRLSECLNDIEQADRLWVAAHAANNGADMLAAQKIKDEARNRAGSLQQERERLAHELTQQRNQPAPQLPVPGGAELAQHAARFRADKPWIQYGPGNQPMNQETAAATLIDAALKSEGRLSPREPAYWAELDKRVKAAMPHMFRANQDVDDTEDDDEEEADPPPRQEAQRGQQQRQAKPPAQKGPRVGSSGRNGGARPNETRLSAEMVAAIKEAGWWDDPKERAEAIKYFKGQA